MLTKEKLEEIGRSCPIPRWRFTRHTIDLMNSITSETKYRERGGTFCGNNLNNHIGLKNISTGGKAMGVVTFHCPPGSRMIGLFHTHPKFNPISSAEPSYLDLVGSELRKRKDKLLFECIGHPGTKKRKKKQEILCYTIKENLTENELEDKIQLVNKYGQEEEDAIKIKDIATTISKLEKTRKDLEKFYPKFIPDDCMI